MVRTSFYDRLSEKRLAAEALARQQAEEAANAPAPIIEPEPVPVLPLELARNELKIAGLALLMPQGFNFRDMDTTFEKDGHPVTLSAKCRPAPEGLTLQRSAELYLDNLRQRHADLTVVRQNDCLLAGNQAIALDYAYMAGQERRHGRAVSAIIESAADHERQWFSLSTVIDPDLPPLASWLIDFDQMLSDIAAC